MNIKKKILEKHKKCAILYKEKNRVGDMKKVLVIGDLHCGSIVGLTPPSWFISPKRDKKLSSLQKEMWSNYTRIIEEIGPVDYLVVNGDAIDGHGKKSHGSELLTTDLLLQAEIAIECIKEIKYEKIFLTHGTPYHTSNEGGEDFEKVIADKLGGKVYDELRLDVDGVIFDIRHHIDSSSVPTGRFNSMAKNRLWDVLRADKEGRKKADVYIRSHVHYYTFCGESDWRAINLPALQASMTKYGSRRCVGITDWGVCCFFVEDGNLSGWESKIVQLENSQPETIKL